MSQKNNKTLVTTGDIARFLVIHRNTSRNLLSEYRVRPLEIRKKPIFAASEVLSKMCGLRKRDLTDERVAEIWSQGLQTSEKAAGELQTSVSTVRRLAAIGALRPIRLGDRILRFFPDDVLAARTRRRT